MGKTKAGLPQRKLLRFALKRIHTAQIPVIQPPRLSRLITEIWGGSLTIIFFPSLYIMEGPATTQPPGEPDGNAVDEETEDSVSGVPAEVEDEIPTDLLADLIQVQDADMKPATRQDYARRVSRYS